MKSVTDVGSIIQVCVQVVWLVNIMLNIVVRVFVMGISRCRRAGHFAKVAVTVDSTDSFERVSYGVG